jgi:hypothetical protein
MIFMVASNGPQTGSHTIWHHTGRNNFLIFFGIAAGGVAYEKLIRKKTVRVAFPPAVCLLAIPGVPSGLTASK